MKYNQPYIAQVKKLRIPSCSKKDKNLHFMFFFSVLVIILCLTLIVHFAKQIEFDFSRLPLHTSVTMQELLILMCGIYLFIAILAAIYAAGAVELTVIKVTFPRTVHFLNSAACNL